MFKAIILVGLLSHTIYLAEAGCVEGRFYPHETECGKFYQCGQGKLELMICPPTLEFSTNHNVCVYPEQSGCTLGKHPGGDCSSTTPDPCSTTTTPTCPTTTSTCSTTTTPCPTTTSTCSTTTTPCPTTTSTCSTTPTPCPTTSSTCSTTPTPCPTTSSTCTPSTPTCSSPPPCTDPAPITIPNPYPLCPVIADPLRDVLLPAPKCCQFIHCTNFGVGIVKNCAPSDPPLVFDQCSQRCVWPWEAGNTTCTLCTC